MMSTRRSCPLTLSVTSRSTVPAPPGWPWTAVVRNRYADEEATAPAATTPLMKVRREVPWAVSSVIVSAPCDRRLKSRWWLRIADRFLHRKRPIQLGRLDDHVKNVGVLLHVADAAAGAGLVDHRLQQAAADGAVGVQPEHAGCLRRLSLLHG